jgi:hypothetical protein
MKIGRTRKRGEKGKIGDVSLCGSRWKRKRKNVEGGNWASVKALGFLGFFFFFFFFNFLF